MSDKHVLVTDRVAIAAAIKAAHETLELLRAELVKVRGERDEAKQRAIECAAAVCDAAAQRYAGYANDRDNRDAGLDHAASIVLENAARDVRKLLDPPPAVEPEPDEPDIPF